jgi:hypothetical protein
MPKTTTKKDDRPTAPAPDPAADAATPAGTTLARAHERYGWALVAAGVAAGTAVESLLGFKSAAFLLDPLRRELWTIAHFHAAFLGIVNLAYARGADAGALSAGARVACSRAMRIGSLLLPAGFFLGGLSHFEGDPGIGILLSPVGALLVVTAAVVRAVYARRG